MNNANNNQRKIEICYISFKQKVQKRQNSHYNTTYCIASLPADAVYHIGNPGTEKHRRESKSSHYNTYIRTQASMICDKIRKKKEGRKTRNNKKIGQCHGNEWRSKQHVILIKLFNWKITKKRNNLHLKVVVFKINKFLNPLL